jgi:hypothetical protein
MKKPLFILLTFILLANANGYADRILRVLAPYGLEDPPHIFTDQGWIVMPFDTNRRGPEIRPAHSDKILLGREAAHSTPEEPVFVTVFEAPLPVGSNEYLFILTARRNNALSGVVIDDSPERYPTGSIRFVNTIGIPIRVQLSEHQANLEHLEQTLTKVTESDFERLTVRAGAYINGQPRVIFNQRRMIRADLRYLLIAYVGAEEQIEIHWLRDR